MNMFRIERFKGKLSPIEMLVLGSLKEEPLFGYEIIDKLKKQFKETSFIPQSGTIYPIFERLEKKELIKSKISPDGRKKRKKYELTEEGISVLKDILRKDDLGKEMDYSNRFFAFIHNIAEIGENLAGFGVAVRDGLEKFDKNLKLERIKNEIRSFKNRIEYHKERIKIHKARIEKLSIKTRTHELELQGLGENYAVAEGSED